MYSVLANTYFYITMLLRIQYVKWAIFPEISNEFTGPLFFSLFFANLRVPNIVTKDKCTLERESGASLSQAGNTT